MNSILIFREWCIALLFMTTSLYISNGFNLELVSRLPRQIQPLNFHSYHLNRIHDGDYRLFSSPIGNYSFMKSGKVFLIGSKLSKIAKAIIFAPYSIRPRIIPKILSRFLHRLVVSQSQFVSGLQVNIRTGSSMEIIRGKVSSIELKFDKICYG